MHGRHPDDDLLADLAADVLPTAQARVVEAHVLGCRRCSAVLADAERIRVLLLTGDPGPMPADVWNRIEAALTDAAGTPAAAPPGSASPRSQEHRRATPGHDDRDAWDDDADPLDTPDHWDSPTAPRPAAASSAVTPRTAVRSNLRRLDPRRREARAGRRGPRPATVLGVAAAAVVVVGLASLVRGASGGVNGSSGSAGSGTSFAAGQDSAAAAAGGSGAVAVSDRYERTGTRYTTAGLARQARALAAIRSLPAPAAAAGGGPAATSGVGPSPAARPGTEAAAGVGPSAAQAATPDPTATDVSNPAHLAGCLQSLKASPADLVAVDLATFDGREAAVLLLRAGGGGYEVFVVERTCSATDEHTLDYATLPG